MTEGQQPDLRVYEAQAASTALVGRVMCSVRNHHYIIDGPVTNGFPGEEVTPSELFLSAVASCGVELIQMLAEKNEPRIALGDVSVQIKGVIDRANPVRPDATLFNKVELSFTLRGVTEEEGEMLIGSFKKR